MNFLKRLVPQRAKNTFKHLPLAVASSLISFWPSRKFELIGVTGTDGKTTVAFLIYHLLSSAGFKTGLVSTVLAKIADEEVETGFHVTSPHPWKLQCLFKKMRRKGVVKVVLEVTSHGLDQHRFWGCRFRVGVLTNVTDEHLDYHRQWQSYLLAKAKLFKNSDLAVLNRDDQSYLSLKKLLKGKKILTYSLKNKADFMAKKIILGKKETKFRLWEKGRLKDEVVSPLLGRFNVYNQLAAIAAVRTLGLDYQTIIKALKTFPGVVGRLEFIASKKGFRIFIDFAHTANALNNLLSYLRQTLAKGGRLIAVFGAAGLRDTNKRTPMGRIAGRLCNLVVLTSEDPRTEDPKKIIDQIAQGCREKGMKKLGLKRAAEARAKKVDKKYFIIPNRQEAVNFAIRKLARPRDIVVLMGKGHERSMCFGTTEYPWSEHEAVKIALKQKR